MKNLLTQIIIHHFFFDIFATNKKKCMPGELDFQNILITRNISFDLDSVIRKMNPEGIFILSDTNTAFHCFPIIFDILPATYQHFTIDAGEKNKNIETLQNIWNFLAENRAVKNSLLINLGGGMITDIGGFAASTYKRGINFINIPTSLLAQVDASIGGKNGINYHHLKNTIGTINFPQTTIVAPEFLKTLPHNELLSGYAEMLKHSLIADNENFVNFTEEKIKEKIDNPDTLYTLIEHSIRIKTAITLADPFEKDVRKALNFGHTFGHAFEEFYMQTEKPLKHGYAVAYGIICELYISHKTLGFDLLTLLKIIEIIYALYGRIDFALDDIPELILLMHQDKKNSDSQINCTCLSKIGKYEINTLITDQTAKDALIFYKQVTI